MPCINPLPTEGIPLSFLLTAVIAMLHTATTRKQPHNVFTVCTLKQDTGISVAQCVPRYVAVYITVLRLVLKTDSILCVM